MAKIVVRLFVLNILISLFTINDCNALFTAQAKTETAVFSTACWATPSIPILDNPEDGSYSTSLDQTLSWASSTSTCPTAFVSYDYQVTDSSDFSSPLFSGTTVSLSLGITLPDDGVYYWRIRSRDNYGQVSSFSPHNTFTIDRSAPSSEITSLDLFSTAPSFSINYLADAGTDFVQLCYSYNLGDWICDPAYIDHPHSPGSILFDSPRGDGLYDFYTLATDHAGNTEDASDKTAALYSVQVDTQAPTTNINLNSSPGNQWNGQNLLTNGGFESGLDSWTIDAPASGDHRVVSTATDFSDNPILPPSGLSMLQIGFSQSPLVDGATDSISQTFSLPSNLSSNLSFNYRFFSQDTADYDHFFVKIISWTGNLFENILQIGNESFIPGDYDSGWQKISHSLLAYAGHTINLLFGVDNKDVPGDPLASWAFIDDIFVSTLDTRVGETGTLIFDPHDIGSGLFDTPDDVNTQVGENPLDFLSTDVAGNIEATHSSDIVVLPSVVLNHIAPAPSSEDETIILYNNSADSQDLTNWQICNLLDHCQNLTGIIDADSTLAFSQNFYLNNTGDTVYLKDDTATVVDEFIYPNHSGTDWYWQRNPDGVGTWQLFAPGLDFNLVSRPAVGKITLSVFNLTADVDYEIIYDASGIQKGIAGSLDFDKMVDGKLDYDLYLGTCSTGGVCTPDSLAIGSTLTVSISGQVKTFTY